MHPYLPHPFLAMSAHWRAIVQTVVALMLLGFAGASWAQCGTGGNLPANQWSLVSLACAPNTATVDGVWGDELGTANYGTTWLVFERDEPGDAYVQLGINDAVNQADAYWVLTLAGAGSWNASPGTTTPTTASGDCPAASCFERPLTAPAGAGQIRENMVGFPFPMAIPFQDVRIRTNTLGTLTPAQAAALDIITDSFWLWSGNAYNVANSITPGMTGSMQPYLGMFIETLDGSIGQSPVLLIPIAAVNDPPDAADDSLTVDEDASQTVLDSGETSLLANDTDPDGDTLTVTNVPPIAPANAAALTLNGDGTFDYEHDGSETTTDTFDYEVCDDGAPVLCATASVAVTINPVNDPPVLDVLGNPSVDEGDPLNFNATATDPDLPGDTLTFTLVGAPTGAGITPGGAFSFTPTENQGPGSFDFDVVVMDNGTPQESDSQTITVTVNEVNEAPTFDSPNPTFGPFAETIANGTAIGSVPASDVDFPANTLTYSITGGNTGTAFAIDNNGDITVNDTSAVDFEVATSFSLTVEVDDNSGAPNATATTGVTVDLTDIAPDIANATFNVNEDIANTALVGIVPSTGDDNSVSFSITSGDPTNAFNIDNDGNLTVNDTDEIDFETTPTFTLTVQATDGTTPDTATITVNVNDVAEPPVLNLDDADNGGNEPNFAATFNAGIGSPVAIVDNSLSVTDPDSAMIQSATVTISNVQDNPDELLAVTPSGAIGPGDINYNTTTGTLTITRTTILADYETVLRTLTYDNDAGTPTLSPDRLINATVTDDGGLTSTAVTATVDVILGPILDLDDDDSTVAGNDFNGAFVEDAGAVGVVDSDVSIDSPSTNIIRATFTLTNRPDGADEGLSVNGALPGGISVTDAYDDADGVLEITGAATAADYETALQQIEYDNANDTPDTTDRSITVEVEDANNVTNPDPATATLTVTAVNDPPTGTTHSYNVTGNVPIDVPAGSGLSQGFTDPEGDSIDTVQVDQTGTAGTVSAVGNDGSFTYTPAAGFSGNDTFTYTLTDDGSPSAATSVPQTVTLNVSTDRIWFLDNSAGAAGDGTLNTPFNTLAAFEAINGGGNAGDPDAGDCIFVHQGSGNYTGGVTLENTQRLVGEGSASSVPALCGITPATFSQMLPTTAAANRPVIANTTVNGHAIDLATGNLVKGLNVGDTATSGTGYGINETAASGITTINEVAITGNGGAFQATGASTLGATFDSISSASAPASGVTLSDVSGTVTINGGSITGAGGSSFALSASTAGVTYNGGITHTAAGQAAVSIAGHATGTVTFQTGTISATGGTGLQLSNADGTYNFNGTTTLNGGDAGIDIVSGSAGTFTFGAGTSITDPSGIAYREDTSTAGVTYNGTITQGNAANAVDINAKTGGTTTFAGLVTANTATATGVDLTNNTGGMIAFNAGLNIDTTSGTGFNATGGGTATVAATGGDESVTTSGGIGVSIVNTTIGGAGITFDSVSASGPAVGIRLTNTGSGDFAANAGAITNASSRGVDLDTVTGDFTYTGSISTTSAGRSVEVTNHSGGAQAGGTTVALTGAIDDNGLGIHLDNNDAGNGATVRFSGGLDLDTGTSTAFNAVNGGTVEVLNGSVTNDIDTSTGTGVNIANTTIGAGGVTFESVSVNGATNGIVLNTTGTTGPFMVAGDGTMTAGVLNRNGSGGTITSTIGVQLLSAHDVTLRQLDLINNGDHAVQGNGGTDHVLSAVTIQSPTNHGWEAIDLQGANRIDHGSLVTQFNGINQDGVRLINTSTDFTSFTVDNVTFSNSSTGNDGFFHRALGGTTGDIVVTNSTFTGLDADGVQVANDGSETIDTTIQGNSFNTADATGGDGNNGLALNLGGTGVHQFLVGGPDAGDENTFTTVNRLGDNSGVINVTAAGAGTGSTSQVVGTIQRNSISDSDGRRGISVLFEASGGIGHGGHTIIIDDNNVNDVAREGIYVGMSTVAGRSNTGNKITITDNNVGDVSVVSTAGNREGIEIEAFHDLTGGGSIEADILVQNNVAVTNNTDETFRVTNEAFTAGDSTTLDVTVLGNTFTNNDAFGDSFEVRNFDTGSSTCLNVNAANIAADRNNANLGYLIDRDFGTYGIEGLAAGTQNDATVNTFVNARNDGGASAASGGSFTGGVTCTLP